MLGVLCVGAFAFPLSAFILGPLLVDVSQTFGVSLAQAGQLVTLAAIPSAVLSLLIGPMSDLYGRRPVLLIGTMVMGVSSVGSAVAPNYEVMAVTRVATGIGAAMVGPSTFAAVADLFSYRERGRAFGVLLAAMNLATILGTPAVTLVAAQWSWRWALAAVGVVLVASFCALLGLYPSRVKPLEMSLRQAFTEGYLPVLRTPSAIAVLVSSLAMSVGWMGFQTYLGAFFIYTYGIGTGGLAPIFATAGIGILIGSQIGGIVGDRIGHKPITLWAVLAATILIVLQLVTTTDIVVATLINFVMSIPMGMRFTSMSVVISEAVPTARGTMNALNSAFFNIGILGGALLGGLLVDTVGFAGISLLVLIGHVGSILVLARYLQERPPESRPSTAAS